MAAASKKKRAKRPRGHSRQSNNGKLKSRYLNIGIIVVIAGLLAFGTYQLLGSRQDQSASQAAALQANSGSLESLDIDGNHQTADAGSTAAVSVTDRESTFLGPPSDPATVSLAVPYWLPNTSACSRNAPLLIIRPNTVVLTKW